MNTLVSGASPSRHDINRMRRSAIGKLTGRQRGPDAQVRRESYDRHDSRAQVFAPIADGTKAGGLGFVDDLVKLAREFDLTHRKPGGRAPLGPYAIAVLEVSLRKFLDFRTGRLDPAIDTIRRHTGFARNTVIRSLARLRANGFLAWVRRTEKAGDGQRQQVTNAYFFEHAATLAKHVLARWRQLRDRRARRKAGMPPMSPGLGSSPPPPATSPGLTEALARMAATTDKPSPR